MPGVAERRRRRKRRRNRRMRRRRQVMQGQGSRDCVYSLSGGSRVGENVILFEQFAGILKLVPVN